MDKKTLGIGICIGVIGSGILNVGGALIGIAIRKRYAKEVADDDFLKEVNEDTQQEEVEE